MESSRTKPTVGRIVLFTLDADDTDAINRRRAYAEDTKHTHPIAGQDLVANGDQVHIGNPAHPGDILPMIIVAVFPGGHVNGQVFLDGSDTLWVTSVREGIGPGTWAWPPRA